MVVFHKNRCIFTYLTTTPFCKFQRRITCADDFPCDAAISDAEAAIDEALEKLDIEYIDLMLLHHPGSNDVDAYHAMEAAVSISEITSFPKSSAVCPLPPKGYHPCTTIPRL